MNRWVRSSLLAGVMLASVAEEARAASCLALEEPELIDLSSGPAQPYYEGTARWESYVVAEDRMAATLAGRPYVGRIVCEPVCRMAAVAARTGGSLGHALPEEASVRAAFARLPVAGALSRAEDLRLVAVERAPDFVRFSYERGVGEVPCECTVIVDVVPGRGIVSAQAAKLEGYEESPRRRSTRDEARQSALVQLSAESPVFMAEGLQRGYVTELLVVPVADEARLVHRFAARLQGLPYLVDVDDRTLEVVRVRPDPVFDRPSPGLYLEPTTGRLITLEG